MGPPTPRVCAAIAIAACGCSYDWSVPESAGDASVSVDATASLDSAPPTAIDASDAGLISPTDAGVDADPCVPLLATADSAYLRAVTCATIGAACVTESDQCGCSKPVADDANVATHDYASAVAALVDAGCTLGCEACGTPVPTKCLYKPIGDGAVTMTCQ